jgi:hypothetical protein
MNHLDDAPVLEVAETPEGVLVVQNGKHRAEAARRLGRVTMPAVIEQVRDIHQATKYSDHGVRRAYVDLTGNTEAAPEAS